MQTLPFAGFPRDEANPHAIEYCCQRDIPQLTCAHLELVPYCVIMLSSNFTGVSTCYPNCATVADERLGRVRCRLAVSSSARGFPFLSLSLRACGVVVWSECAGGFV